MAEMEFGMLKLEDRKPVVMKLLSGPVEKVMEFRDQPFVRNYFFVEADGWLRVFSCNDTVRDLMALQGIRVGTHFCVERRDGKKAIHREYHVHRVPSPPVPPAWWRTNGVGVRVSRRRKPEEFWTDVDWMRDRLDGLLEYRDLLGSTPITSHTRKRLERVLADGRYEERRGIDGMTPAYKRVIRRVLRSS